MYSPLPTDSEVERLRWAGPGAVAELFCQHRERLERMVSFRLDPRVSQRIDPSDILQESYLEAAARWEEYLSDPQVSAFVWLRQITYQQLLLAHRKHFRQKRDARQEHRDRRTTGSTSVVVLRALIGDDTSPSQLLLRAEHLEQMERALSALERIDREVLVLRHFEHLGNDEIAEVLGLTRTAASNRYVRALQRLHKLLSRESGLNGAE